MRSFKVVRFACIAALALAALGAAAIASAQDATPEATPDATQAAMMQQMMSLEGTCPEGLAATWLAAHNAGYGEANGEVPTAEATMDTSMMSATETPMPANPLGACLYGEFSGSAEVPGPGAPDAAGVAYVSVNSTTGNICYDVAIMNVTLPAAAMHIHNAATGASGDIVVPFSTAPNAAGVASGCTTADVALAQQIVASPGDYYVNVHTSDFPKGAARAQLAAWDASMTSMNEMSATEEADMGMGAEMTPEPTTAG